MPSRRHRRDGQDRGDHQDRGGREDRRDRRDRQERRDRRAASRRAQPAEPQVPNTGLELCDRELREMVQNMANTPFNFTSHEDIFAARSRNHDSARTVQEKYRQEFGEELDYDERILRRRDGSTFKLAIFCPRDNAPSGGRPVLYFIHGGGFVINNRFSGIDTIFYSIRELHAVCVSVEYGLAPEFEYPTQVQDCFDGLQEIWNRRNGNGLLRDVNRDNLAVIGRSAGASLLVQLNQAVKQQNDPRKKIRCNVMSFPMLDSNCGTESHDNLKNAPFLPSSMVEFCWDQYLGSTEDRDKWISQRNAMRNGLSGFPPTLVELAKADVLYDEGVKFAQRLQDRRCHVTTLSYNGFHCFDGAGGGTRIGDECKNRRADYLLDALA